MRTPERMARFLAAQPCRVGDVVTLPPEQSRHMTVVLRIGRGQMVRVFTGQGAEYVGQVEVADPTAALVRICTEYAPARADTARLILAFAPAPGLRTESLIEKATEFGADCLQPLLCERLQGFQAESAAHRGLRWRRKAEEAARQAQRAAVPELRPPMPFDAFVQEAEAGLRLIASTTGARSLWQVLQETAQAPSSVAMAVGPAGGFTRRELDAAAAASFVPVSLGPNVLRVETAALALLSAVALWLDRGNAAAGLSGHGERV
jgi:16S rRNA (uracil1498-N3)-methyltransferase